ncbi:MAG TPA: TlpA disulfide reductase family protein [Dokdonella sp.]
MFNRLNLLIVTIALASASIGLLASLWLQPSANGPALQKSPFAGIGNARTDFQRSDLKGIPRKLSEWDGKLIVLNFWASWCGPCREEMPLLERSQQRYAAKGVQIIGIAADTDAATQAFLKQSPVTYPVLVDDPQRGDDLSFDYGNTRSVLPYTVLIGRDGRVLAQHFGEFSQTSLERWLAPYL